MASFLVTGGAGFIGSHLVEALIARGDAVTVYDDVSTGTTANLAAVSDHERLRFVRGNICDAYTVDELVRSHDVVMHMAAAVGVRLLMEQPLRSLTTNVQGCEHVIHSAARYGRKLVYASTSEVYGKTTNVPLAETADSVIGPPNITRWSDAVAEVGNIGSQEEVSIEELAQRVAAQAGSTAGLEHVTHREVYGDGFEDMVRRVPDTRKIKRLIGWEPERDLDTILRETMAEVSGRAPRAVPTPVG